MKLLTTILFLFCLTYAAIAKEPEFRLGAKMTPIDPSAIPRSMFPEILGVHVPFTLGRSFYFSDSEGDDSRTSTQAQSSATPWKTLAKLNSSMSVFSAGDSIKFERGDTFYGSIRWGTSNGTGAKNGTSTEPYVFTSYGSGALPIISGFTTVTGWTNISGNIWESTAAVPSGLSTLEMVTIDGTQYAKGRYPNAGASGTGIENGYFLIDSHSGATSFTDASNPSSGTDWDGAKVVARLAAWVIQIIPLTSHNGNTFTATARQNYTDGYGYFISDHQSTLDAQGEWFYNTSTKKLRIYSTVNPSGLTVKASTQDTLMQFYDDDWIVVDGLQIEGANKWAMFHYSAANNTVKNCTVRFSGQDGIRATNGATTTFTATGNTIEQCNDFGIYVGGVGNGLFISQNTISYIGMYAGMGVKTNPTQHSFGVFNNGGSGHSFSYNYIHHIGYGGMRAVGGASPIEYNTIHDYALVADDVGGIYTSGSGSTLDKIIRYNMIWNGLGAPEGRNGNNNAVGIYIEDNSQNYQIYGNYTWNCGQYGLYLHNAKNIDVHDNYFEGDYQAVMIKHDDDQWAETDLIKFKNNICFYKKTDYDFPYVLSVWNRHSKDSILGMPVSAADFDYNYYIQPIAPQTDLIYTIVYLFNALGTEVRTFHTLAEWRTYSGFDLNSQTTPLTYDYNTTENADVFRMVYNPNFYDSTVTLAQSYRDSKNQIYYAGSLVVPARTAIMLMESSDVPPAPASPTIYYKNGTKQLRNGNKRISK